MVYGVVTLKFKKFKKQARKDIERAFRKIILNPATDMLRLVEDDDLHVRKTKELRDRKTHTDLRQDLMEHLWNNDDE
ncbi:hypothetical protein Tco_0479205 [Tanacetum coccineum]